MTPATTHPDPNVLLIVLDSVRAENTSLHATGVETTPYLDEFAAEATVYEHARAPSSWSLPSHVSLFTGDHAHSHGITRTSQRLPAGHTIFESLSDDGYATGVFTENPFLVTDENGLCVFDHVADVGRMKYPDALDAEEFVFAEGEGRHVEYLKACLSHDQPIRSLLNGLELKLRHTAPGLPFVSDTALAPGTEFAGEFLSWVDDRSEPWAACMNLMDAHTPYEPTELHEADDQLLGLRDTIGSYIWDFYAGDHPWWVLQAMEAVYNDAIRDADAAVETVVDGLRERGVLDETLVVVTSDHGEAFGEVSETHAARVAGHGRWATEELLHVPLVVRHPEQSEGARVSAASSLTEFPRVVEDVRAGREGCFVPESEPVVASVYWEDDHLLPDKYAGRVDADLLSTPSRVAYETGDEGVVKTIERGGTRAVLRVASAGAKWRTGADGVDLDAAFERTDTSAIETGRGGGYDEETMDRLRDLGYA